MQYLLTADSRLPAHPACPPIQSTVIQPMVDGAVHLCKVLVNGVLQVVAVIVKVRGCLPACLPAYLPACLPALRRRGTGAEDRVPQPPALDTGCCCLPLQAACDFANYCVWLANTIKCAASCLARATACAAHCAHCGATLPCRCEVMKLVNWLMFMFGECAR